MNVRHPDYLKFLNCFLLVIILTEVSLADPVFAVGNAAKNQTASLNQVKNGTDVFQILRIHINGFITVTDKIITDVIVGLRAMSSIWASLQWQVLVIIDTWFRFHEYVIPLLTAVTAIGGVFGGQFLLQHALRPIIFVERNLPGSVIVRGFHVNLCSFDDSLIPEHLRIFALPYWANRVIVRNRGRRAAEECKGALKIITTVGNLRLEGEELKLRWIPVQEQYKMTINAFSEEYLDVCALLQYEGDIMADLTDYLDAVRDAVYEINIPTLVNSTIRRIKEYHELYPNQASIPQIIAPTENGWPAVHQCRRLVPTGNNLEYRIVVTSKNSNRVGELVNIGERIVGEPIGTAIRFI